MTIEQLQTLISAKRLLASREAVNAKTPDEMYELSEKWRHYWIADKVIREILGETNVAEILKKVKA